MDERDLDLSTLPAPPLAPGFSAEVLRAARAELRRPGESSLAGWLRVGVPALLVGAALLYTAGTVSDLIALFGR